MEEPVEVSVRPTVRVILEQSPNNWAAYVPSIPGCVAVGKTRKAVERNIQEALTLHLQDLHEVAQREEAVRAALAESGRRRE